MAGLVEGIKRRLLGLCLPPVLFCLLDASVTLYGQSAQYWAGDHTQVNEGSPTFHYLLQINPAAFAAGILVWVLIFVVGLLLLPSTMALVVSIVVTFGHTAGTASWVYLWLHHGYQISLGLFLVSATVLGVGIRWGWHAVPQYESRPRGWGSFARWGLAFVLFAVAGYLFLWPRNLGGPEGVNPLPYTMEAIASTDRELEQLGAMRQLTQLFLAGPKITDKGLEYIKQVPHLQGLRLREVQIKSTGLKCLEGRIELEWLSIDRVEIADAELECLGSLTKLRSLDFRGPQVTDVWLQHLARVPQLQSLVLVDTKVTDAGMKCLKDLKQLQTLNLVGSLVSNDGLKCFKGIPQLQSLFITEAKITDAGLEHLKELGQLRCLRMIGTNCTPEGKKKLKRTLTRCVIF